MCGIVGKLHLAREKPVSQAEIAAMMHPIIHRGPDGAGTYVADSVGLGHRRLSIIDLNTGDQPMCNEDRSVWIVFNGEIYNYRDLRADLIRRGHVFSSTSDTEVVIHLYEEYGTDCLQHLRGMFALAIWDRKADSLFVARDRLGIKPLYYAVNQGWFLFSSELKGIMTDSSVPRSVDPDAIRLFLSFNYLPGEATLFSNVRRLLPGHYALITGSRLVIRQYWDLSFEPRGTLKSFDDTVEELYQEIGRCVREHMVSDVPIGVLLSGGVDSSAVLSLAAGFSSDPISTFTVGFDGEGVIDERPYARMAAERFGTRHHEVTISAEDFVRFLPSYVHHIEDPVCEPPAVALYFVSKLAREHVKVLLSGEGGDEAFAGYPNYPTTLRSASLARSFGVLAPLVGSIAARAGDALGDNRLKTYGHAFGRSLAEHYFSRTSSPAAYFNQSMDRLLTADFRRRSVNGSASAFIRPLLEQVRKEPLLHQMLFVDSKTWLPDDLLVKADKITMANSVELRVPLLDHQLVEYAASLPPSFKVHGRETKRVLKAAFARVLPHDVINRRKAGFPVPYPRWLQRDLAPIARSLILSDRALARGYFEPEALRTLLAENERTGQRAKEVFCLMTLEYWHRRFVENDVDEAMSAA